MNIISTINEVINIEKEALTNLSSAIDKEYEKVVHNLVAMKGKAIFSGVGKSGLIAKKISATFSSLGIPSLFVHSTELVHGDLGAIEEEDIVLLFSNSGETSEVVNVIPYIRHKSPQIIAVTSNPESSLATKSDITLNYVYEREADGLGLAPTTSTTVMLVIGDSLASTVAKIKKVSKEDFYLNHPGGSLGQSLANNNN